MTIDEVIKHVEEVAEENLRVVDTGIVFDDVTIDELYCDDTEVIEEHLANYQKCAEEHRQLAEWLKELKQLREQTTWIPCSERLPKDKETVLVTFKHFVSGNTIGLGSVILLRGKPHWHVREQSLGTYDVLAWMPLPPCYDPQESEDKE